MAEIRPFRGSRYSAAAGPLDVLIAPPYDVMTPAERNGYAARSPFNIVHLTLPEGHADDRSKFVKYARSGALLSQWQREGVLAPETMPALYRYTQSFSFAHGKQRIDRVSLIALLKVEPFSNRTVLPHEYTFPKHKEDRLRLLEATRAHLESIYGLYEDPSGDLLAKINGAPAAASVSADIQAIGHKLEVITDPDVLAEVAKGFADKRIWIADGHHRYETALAFRQALGEREGPVAEDYMVIALSSMSDPGLVILPTHRLFPKQAGRSPEGLLAPLQALFDIESVHTTRLPGELHRLHEAGTRVFGLATEGGRGFVLTPKDEKTLLARMTTEGSDRLKGLDASVLHKVVIEQLWGLSPSEPIEYIRGEEEAIRITNEGGGPAILMTAPTVEDMKAIALTGERMPQKSTYYYPKIWSGIVLWTLADFDK